MDDTRQSWMSTLKDTFRKSPLASSSVFSFILLGLEKLVEVEFECPCNPTWNALYSSGLFIIPALLALVLMLLIQRSFLDKSCCNKVISSVVPALVWLELLFFDGKYFVCANTYWMGRFVNIDKTDRQKWCKPMTYGKDLEEIETQMHHSKRYYIWSQIIGMAFLALFFVGVVVHTIRQYCKKEPNPQESTGQGRENVALRRTGVDETEIEID